MKQPEKHKGLFEFIASILLLCYFLAMIFSYNYKYDSKFLGVTRELLTIPFLLALIVLLVLALNGFRKHKYSLTSYYFYSLIISTGTVLFLIFSS